MHYIIQTYDHDLRKRRAKGPWPLIGESELSALDKCLNNSRFTTLNNKYQVMQLLIKLSRIKYTF